MKCKKCNACRKGWFESKPNDYVCIGVQEPFVIKDINVECTEYKEKKEEKVGHMFKRKYQDVCNSINCQKEEIEGLTMENEILRGYITKIGKELERANIKIENQAKVVRCKDCNVPHNEWTGCPKLTPDFYCAFGEPKTKDKH